MTFKTQLHIVIIVLSMLIFSSCSEDPVSSGETAASRRIFFYSRGNSEYREGIYSVSFNADGLQLIDSGRKYLSSSPIGNTQLSIVYEEIGGVYSVHSTNLRTLITKSILTRSKPISYAATSPDGSYICYSVAGSSLTQGGIYVYNVESQKEKLITGSHDVSLGFTLPVFSPDSRKILFVEDYLLRIVDLNSEDKITLTDDFICNGTLGVNFIPQEFDWVKDNTSVSYTDKSSSAEYLIKTRDIATSVVDSLIVTVYPQMVRCSPSGNIVAFIGSQQDVYLWDRVVKDVLKIVIPTIQLVGSQFAVTEEIQWSEKGNELIIQQNIYRDISRSRIDQINLIIIDPVSGQVIANNQLEAMFSGKIILGKSRKNITEY